MTNARSLVRVHQNLAHVEGRATVWFQNVLTLRFLLKEEGEIARNISNNRSLRTQSLRLDGETIDCPSPALLTTVLM